MRNFLIVQLFLAPLLAGCAILGSGSDSDSDSMITEDVATESDNGDGIEDVVVGLLVAGALVGVSVTNTVNDPSAANNIAARHFVDSQFILVRRDAAAGGGEHTRALGRLMGARNPNEFGRWMQGHYRLLFEDLATRTELVDRIAAQWDASVSAGQREEWMRAHHPEPD